MISVGVLLLALMDSINPSAIVVTLYLLSSSQVQVIRRVGVYLSAIFVTYLTLGVVLTLGIDVVLPADALRSRAGLMVQSLLGLVLLIFSLSASTESAPTPVTARPSASTYAAIALLGIGVTIMELPTAIPYFAAIAMVSQSGLSFSEWAPLLVAYNLIFVLPPLLLLVGHVLARRRLEQQYAKLRLSLEKGARECALWVAGLVGGAMLVTGIIELLARFD